MNARLLTVLSVGVSTLLLQSASTAGELYDNWLQDRNELMDSNCEPWLEPPADPNEYHICGFYNWDFGRLEAEGELDALNQTILQQTFGWIDLEDCLEVRDSQGCPEWVYDA